MKRAAKLVAATVLLSSSSLLCQGQFNTPKTWSNAAGPWWRVVGGHGQAGSCSCYFDPALITELGSKNIWADDTVIWKAGGGTAGVSLDFTGLSCVSISDWVIPFPVHADHYIADINNFLESWTDGACDGGGSPCPEVSSCGMIVSFTLDSSLGEEWPVDFLIGRGDGAGQVVSTQTLDKTDPNKRSINLSMNCSPGCGGSGKWFIDHDGGITQPRRRFQDVWVSCTSCGSSSDN